MNPCSSTSSCQAPAFRAPLQLRRRDLARDPTDDTQGVPSSHTSRGGAGAGRSLRRPRGTVLCPQGVRHMQGFSAKEPEDSREPSILKTCHFKGTAGAGLPRQVEGQGRKPRMSAPSLLPRVPLGWCRGWQGPPAVQDIGQLPGARGGRWGQSSRAFSQALLGGGGRRPEK